MRILATQETDWISRNPIIHHRLLEWLSTHGSDVRVIDYDIDWAKKKGPIRQGRQEFADIHKYYADARVSLVRPAMLRLPLIARLSWLVGNWRELGAIFRAQAPDVLVAYGISNALLTLAFSRARRKPFIYHVMDALHTHADAALVRLVARNIESFTMRHADRVVVVSKGLGRYAVAMGAPADRVEVVPIGVRKIGADPELGSRARALLGVAENEVMLIFVGWQYPFSGLRELVQDFARRGREVPWLRLVIVGSGELYDELQRIRSAGGLERQVVMTGQRPVDEVGGLTATRRWSISCPQRSSSTWSTERPSSPRDCPGSRPSSVRFLGSSTSTGQKRPSIGSRPLRRTGGLGRSDASRASWARRRETRSRKAMTGTRSR